LKFISDLEDIKAEKSPKSGLLSANEDKSYKYKRIYLPTIYLKNQKVRSDLTSQAAKCLPEKGRAYVHFSGAKTED